MISVSPDLLETESSILNLKISWTN